MGHVNHDPQVLNCKFAEVDELLRTGGIAPAWRSSGSYDGRPIDDIPAIASSVRIFAKSLPPIHKNRANPLSPLSLGGVGPIGGYNSGGNGRNYTSTSSHATLQNTSSNSYQNSLYTDGYGNRDVSFPNNANDDTSSIGLRHPSPSKVKFPQSPSIKGRSVNAEVSLPSVGLPRRAVGDSPVRSYRLRQSTGRLNVNSEDGRDLSASVDSNCSPRQRPPQKARSVNKLRDSQTSVNTLRVSYAGSSVLDDTDESLIQYILNDETLLF